MHPVLTLFWIAAAVATLVGAIITIVGLYRAPEGFEDGSGFHYVNPPEALQAGKDPAHAGVPHPTSVTLA